MANKYTEATHLQTAAEGQSFGVGKYKHQVMNKSGLFPLIYSNNLEEARNYLTDNRAKWVKADKAAEAYAKKNK